MHQMLSMYISKFHTLYCGNKISPKCFITNKALLSKIIVQQYQLFFLAHWALTEMNNAKHTSYWLQIF